LNEENLIMRRPSPKKRISAIFAACAFSAGLGHARADTPVSWANTNSNGNWSDPTQWTPEVTPNGAYAVTLPAGNETVSLDISPTIDSLTLGSGPNLEANSGSTTLTTAFLNDAGNFYFRSGGILTVTGQTTNSDFIDVANDSTATLVGDVSNSGNFYTGYAGSGNDTVNVSGTFTVTSAGGLNVYGAGDIVNVKVLNNQGALNDYATVNITGGGLGITDIPSTALYSLYGNFNVINGGVATSALANLSTVEGSLYLRSGLAYNVGSLNNSGGIYIANATTLSVAGNLTNSGNLYTSYGGSADNTVNVSGTFTNTSAGNLDVFGSGDVVNVNALNNQGDMNLGATFNITGGGSGVTDVVASSTYSLYSNFNVINGGVATSALANLSTVEGNLYLRSGLTYNVGSVNNSGGIYLANATTLSAAGSFTNSNSLYMSYGGSAGNAFNVGGTFTNTTSGNFDLFGSGDIANVKALNNQGSLSVDSGATLNITGGGLGVTDVVASSTYSLYSNFNVINGGVATSALANLSTVEGDLYLRSGLTYGMSSLTTSGGIFVANATTLALSGSITNSGNVYTSYAGSADNTVNVSGTFTNTSTGDLTLFGSGDVVNVNSLNNQGDLNLDIGATLNITGGGLGVTDIPSTAFYSVYGDFNVINHGIATAALVNLATVEGDLYLRSGLAYTVGSLSNSGGIFLANATTLSVAGNLTNSSTLYTSYGGAPGNILNVSGTFTNTNTATLNIYNPGDVVAVNTLNNQGDINVYSGAALAVGSGALTESGGPGGGGLFVGGTGASVGVLTQSGSAITSVAGPLAVYNNGRVNLNGGNMAATALTITGNGIVNLNGALNINFGSAADPISTIVGYLTNGYNHGNWAGTTGIISTNAAASAGKAPLFSVGYADGNNAYDLARVPGLQPNQVRVMYTLAGDANLDGNVNFADLLIVAQNFNKTGEDWVGGNFVYNPTDLVNFADLLIVAQNFNQSLPPGVTAVSTGGNIVSLDVTLPEPAASALTIVAGLGLLARRKRKGSAPTCRPIA
jgi:filamentous hemagglutinin